MLEGVGYYGARFAPSTECQLIKARVYSYIGAGSASECILYVIPDADGKPAGTAVFNTTYMPTHNIWQEFSITPPISYTPGNKFWIVIKIPVKTASSYVWAITDGTLDYPYENTYHYGEWKVPPDLLGDLLIRAVISYTGVEEEELLPSGQVTLMQNYPNPVLNKTAISYTLPGKMKVKLEVYDVTGRLIRILLNDVQPAGFKEVVWDKRNQDEKVVCSGIYFYKLNTGNQSFTKVMVVL